MAFYNTPQAGPMMGQAGAEQIGQNAETMDRIARKRRLAEIMASQAEQANQPQTGLEAVGGLAQALSSQVLGNQADRMAQGVPGAQQMPQQRPRNPLEQILPRLF